MKTQSYVWHPNTQMREWDSFNTIIKAKGIWLTSEDGTRLIDGVASMWCNVWGHSKPELIKAINNQSKKLQHASMFNLTNEPAENLAKKLIEISPNMHKVFYSDNGSTAVEIALKMAIQYWSNTDQNNKTKIASLENGYHGDTFGAMSVGYIPEFFKKFKKHIFKSEQFKVPNKYRIPKGFTYFDYQEFCLEKIEKKFSNDDKFAALIMESGAQVAGGVNIFPKNFQRKLGKLCRKHDVLFILDEIATGLGRLGSMVQYTEQKSIPDIVTYGKMLTGGYLTLAATLTNKKIYNSFLGNFNECRHLFHGHTFTGNSIAAAVANENLKLYQKNNLIKKIQTTSRIFENYHDNISKLEMVGDVRHKGMLMGIEIVKNKKTKLAIKSKISINKIFFEEGQKHGVYLRTLGNIVMIVPPLAISEKELTMLLDRTIKTINSSKLYFK